MYTYNDFVEARSKQDFVHQAIQQHRNTELYQIAVIADEYDRQQNRTIMNYRKLLYTITGKAVTDSYSANYKMPSGYFNRFVTQQNQYLLGNGITWNNEDTADKLGDDFDRQVQKAGKEALVGGVSFGFFNYDHLEVFNVREFVPLYDEENGALMAGIRFWQVDLQKPLRATLYEIDGYTDYIWIDGKGKELAPKKAYIEKSVSTEADGVTIYAGENYPTFPIVPLWGNPHHQSEIIGIREEIDAYDLIKSGFANDIDDASQIYWTLENAGGMDDVDLVQFLERMKTVKAAVVDDNAKAEAHTLDVPYNAREAILERLEKDLYKDYMALDTERLASGAVTATQIRAAYEPLDNKSKQYEYCIEEFIQGILAIKGIEDKPTFSRARLVNMTEEINTVLSAAEYLDAEYVTEKILTLMGDGNQTETVLARMREEDFDRFNGGESE